MLYCLQLFINVNPRGKKCFDHEIGVSNRTPLGGDGLIVGFAFDFYSMQSIKGSRMVSNYSDIDDSCVNFTAKG